jgi:hypothetical protein
MSLLLFEELYYLQTIILRVIESEGKNLENYSSNSRDIGLQEVSE